MKVYCKKKMQYHLLCQQNLHVIYKIEMLIVMNIGLEFHRFPCRTHFYLLNRLKFVNYMKNYYVEHIQSSQERNTVWEHIESSQQTIHTKHVFSWCFTLGKLGGVLHKNINSHQLQILVCLAKNDVSCRKICEILDLFSSFW